MSYPLFAFNGAPQQNQAGNMANLAQYQAQGQMGINPGQMKVAASDPIAAAAQSGLGGSLQTALKNAMTPTPQQPTNSGFQSMNGAPVTNQGLFDTYDPSKMQQGMQQNSQNPTATPGNIPQPSWTQQLGNYLSGMFGGS